MISFKVLVGVVVMPREYKYQSAYPKIGVRYQSAPIFWRQKCIIKENEQRVGVLDACYANHLRRMGVARGIRICRWAIEGAMIKLHQSLSVLKVADRSNILSST